MILFIHELLQNSEMLIEPLVVVMPVSIEINNVENTVNNKDLTV
jgi:hypothetical protein